MENILTKEAKIKEGVNLSGFRILISLISGIAGLLYPFACSLFKLSIWHS
jgi:hypothetical protein